MEAGIQILGISERASYVNDGNSNLIKWNALGLKQHVISSLYPLSICDYSLALAVNLGHPASKFTVAVVDESNKKIGTINFDRGDKSSHTQDKEETVGSRPLVFANTEGWTLLFLPMTNLNFSVEKPGCYTFQLDSDGQFISIGKIIFHFVECPPLTPDRIAAIKSDPTSARFIRYQYKCNSCKDELKVYAALEKDRKENEQGYTWYQDLPHEFACSCGIIRLDTRYLKSLHFALGTTTGSEKELGFIPRYERSSLEQILRDFKILINENVVEERLQQFIQDNIVILHQFPSARIFFKPSVLGQYHADFAILTPKRELILIEIERADIRLLNKNGHRTAALNHAIGQVEDWLHKVDEHRQAFLSSLNLERTDVSQISGVVIAGRDTDHNQSHLHKLKGTRLSSISFYTYDDVAGALNSLINNFASK